MSESFLFSKVVDMSTLYEGISVPVAFHKDIFRKLGLSLKRGEQAPIVVKIFDLSYEEALIKNQWFDSVKYPNRSDIVQIRYSRNSQLAKQIRQIFSKTTATVDHFIAVRDDESKLLVIPENEREYISLYVDKGSVRFECIPRSTGTGNLEEQSINENVPYKRDVLTSSFLRNADVVNWARIRARGICQLCGNQAPFVDKDGKPYLEVHHVIWLSRGGADNLENAVALCPNCHSKMHIVDDPQDVERLLQVTKGN